MLLRKKASFKPNLKQVSAQSSKTVGNARNDVQGQQETTTTSTSTAAITPATISPSNSTPTTEPAASTSPSRKQVESSETSSQATRSSSPKHATDNDAGLTERRVQEAISQLTSRNFEPIKSLNLRISANRNVKLKDLLFLNPPMTKDQKRYKRQRDAKKVEIEKAKDESDRERHGSGSQSSQGDNEQHLSLAPKVKMGPGGKLILDESSTLISRKNFIKEQDAIIEDHEDVVSRTNYDSFRRRPTSTSQAKWSVEDTEKFYHALAFLGTDFSLMESLIFSGSRSRTELHKKFKREERVNKRKIDIALANRIYLDSEELNDVFEGSKEH